MRYTGRVAPVPSYQFCLSVSQLNFRIGPVQAIIHSVQTRGRSPVPKKIFISYRRDDSAANALGIGQYLEHEFGSKNVFIDVDMRAGTNFPSVLEQRLAECKVMLVLIGPNWLNAKDDLGSRRLDDPYDWVRLEIATALKHQITVIPVRINGTDLPLKSALPEDIQGLLNYQAVSATHIGFRHEWPV